MAQQQGSHLYSAVCGYQLASLSVLACSSEWGLKQPAQRPSTVLEWVGQAKAADRRCHGVLLGVMVAQLSSSRAAPKLAYPWLQQRQEQGDAWADADENIVSALEVEEAAGLSAPHEHRKEACANCGTHTPHLLICQACKRTAYCW